MEVHSLSERRRALLLISCFAVVVFTTLGRHEMWLDELNPWVIARDAASLPELFYNMRFERHPALWYLCLYAVTRLTSNPVAMQMLHGVIACSAVAVLAVAAPFRWRDKWLIAFGYYFIFEYAVISRGYALGVFCVLLATALIRRSPPPAVPIAVLLGLAANTSAMGLLLATAVAAGLTCDARVYQPRGRALAATVLFVSAAAVSIWTLLPHPENMFAKDPHTAWSVERASEVVTLFWVGVLPAPEFTSAMPWNTSLWLAEASRLFGHPYPLTVLAALLLAAGVLAVRRSPAAVVTLGVGTVSLLAFFYLAYSAGPRHPGHFFILLIVCLWIARAHPGRPPVRSAAARWFAPVLVLNLAAGAFFVVQDLARPFSFSKELAGFVRMLPDPAPIVVAQNGFLSYAGPVLSGYLERPVYYVVSDEAILGSYLWYDLKRRRGAHEHEIATQLEHLSATLESDLYVVTNAWRPRHIGRRIAQFSNHLAWEEQDCSIYLYRRPKHTRAAP